MLLTTLLGLAVGYKVSNFEDNYESYILKAKQENPLAPVHPRSSLLTYQAMVRQKQEEQSEGSMFFVVIKCALSVNFVEYKTTWPWFNSVIHKFC